MGGSFEGPPFNVQGLFLIVLLLVLSRLGGGGRLWECWGVISRLPHARQAVYMVSYILSHPKCLNSYSLFSTIAIKLSFRFDLIWNSHTLPWTFVDSEISMLSFLSFNQEYHAEYHAEFKEKCLWRSCMFTRQQERKRALGSENIVCELLALYVDYSGLISASSVVP